MIKNIVMQGIVINTYTYLKNANGDWYCSEIPSIIDDLQFKGKIRVDFSSDKTIPQNATKIETCHHSDTGDELLRFYYYDPINYHISLSRQMKNGQNKPEFNKALVSLYKTIDTYIEPHINKITFNKDIKFEFLVSRLKKIIP